jgi:hypothetical protein
MFVNFLTTSNSAVGFEPSLDYGKKSQNNTRAMSNSSKDISSRPSQRSPPQASRTQTHLRNSSTSKGGTYVRQRFLGKLEVNHFPKFSDYMSIASATSKLLRDMRRGYTTGAALTQPGVLIKDHERGFFRTVYPKTFSGSDAVSWVVKYCLDNKIVQSEDPDLKTSKETTQLDRSSSGTVSEKQAQSAKRPQNKKSSRERRVDRNDATLLLQYLLDNQIFKDVYSNSRKFADDRVYYRFSEDEQEEKSILNPPRFKRHAESVAGKVNGLQLSITLLKQIMAVFNSVARSSYYPPHICAQNAHVVQQDVRYKDFANETASLRDVDLRAMDKADRFCFFLNVYNTLTMHACIEEIPPHTSGPVQLNPRSAYQETFCFCFSVVSAVFVLVLSRTAFNSTCSLVCLCFVFQLLRKEFVQSR